MTPIQKTGEFLFRYRDYTPIPIIILAILFAEPSVLSLALGLGVACLGEFVRTYGVAYIGTISRTRSYSNGQLVQEGPFGVLRNPLYLGNLLLSVGLSIMSGVLWLPLVVIVFFYAQYIPIVAWEEMKLINIFGSVYLEYCNKVPQRWFPKLSAVLSGDWYVKPSEWAPALRSERRTLTSVIAFLLVMTALFYANLNFSDSPLLPLIHRIPIFAR